MYRYIIYLFLFNSSLVHAEEFLMCMPKSGTHLIKALSERFLQESVPFEHLSYKQGPVEGMVEREFHPEKKILFVYRDPRDVAVSWMYDVDKRRDLVKNNGLDWHSLPRDAKLNRISVGNYPNLANACIRKLGPMYHEFLKYPSDKVCMCKFEELIGHARGGDRNQHLRALSKLAKFLRPDKNYTVEELRGIFSLSFGNSWTFRNPQVGQWKTHFTETTKILFKNGPWGQALLELEYENDSEW